MCLCIQRSKESLESACLLSSGNIILLIYSDWFIIQTSLNIPKSLLFSDVWD